MEFTGYYYIGSLTQAYSINMIQPWLMTHVMISGVKYLSKNTLKYDYVVFGVSVLYFIIYIFDNVYFYFTTFLNKIMYFLLHTFSLTPKSTRYILNA